MNRKADIENGKIKEHFNFLSYSNLGQTEFTSIDCKAPAFFVVNLEYLKIHNQSNQWTNTEQAVYGKFCSDVMLEGDYSLLIKGAFFIPIARILCDRASSSSGEFAHDFYAIKSEKFQCLAYRCGNDLPRPGVD